LAARLEEFSAALAEGAPRTAQQALAIEVHYRTLVARRALLRARAADGWLRGCCAMSGDAEALQRVFAERPPNAPDAGGDVFMLQLGLRWDSWIEQPTAPRIPERLPAWYRPFLPSAVSFVVMPQNRGDGAVGLIYLDGPAVRADALGEPGQRLLRTLGQLPVGAVIARRCKRPCTTWLLRTLKQLLIEAVIAGSRESSAARCGMMGAKPEANRRLSERKEL